MLISPPDEKLLDLPSMNLMQLFGQMRSITNEAGFTGTLPAIWQCSDESQAIKKALFGYVYNCPPINLGQTGALFDPSRWIPATNHGGDIVVLGGSHIGAEEKEGIGYIQRINEQVSPCCGVLHRILDEYMEVYKRATQRIKVFRDVDSVKIEIPYMYLFHEPQGDRVTIDIKLDRLVEGKSLSETARGKLYQLHPEMLKKHSNLFAIKPEISLPIGSILVPDSFSFSKNLDHDSLKPKDVLEVSLFDFMPEVVSSSKPHKRLCDLNTWKQFHRITSNLTDNFDVEKRNVFVLAGLTIDHTVQHNSFVPQFGFLMEKGRSRKPLYLASHEIHDLISKQKTYQPTVTFLEYAGQS